MNNEFEFNDFVSIINKFIGKNDKEIKESIKMMTSLNEDKFQFGKRIFLSSKKEYLELIEKIFDNKLQEMESLHNSVK